MRRSFAVHFGAWVLAGVPALMLLAFALRSFDIDIVSRLSPIEFFIYGFTIIPVVSLIGATIDCSILSALDHRRERRRHPVVTRPV